MYVPQFAKIHLFAGERNCGYYSLFLSAKSIFVYNVLFSSSNKNLILLLSICKDVVVAGELSKGTKLAHNLPRERTAMTREFCYALLLGRAVRNHF